MVSDLHMAAKVQAGHGRADRLDDFRADTAFVAFLDHLGRRPPPEAGTTRLVLLGDALDFVRVPVPTREAADPRGRALRRLEHIASSHDTVFAALGRLLTAGVDIVVVPGNHDMELMDAEVWRAFEALIRPGGARGGRLTLEPWIVYVPGLLYAEHGQQHHDINRFPALLHSYYERSLASISWPLGVCLDELTVALAERLPSDTPEAPSPVAAVRRAARDDPRGLRTAVAPCARAGWCALRRGAGAAVAQRRLAGATAEHVRRHATGLALDPWLVADLERLGNNSPASPARRLLRRAAERTGALEPPALPYMAAAARRVHGLLAAAGAAVPFYVFGHTHGADERALDEGPRAPRYFNTGTWSLAVRPAPGRSADSMSYVELSRTGPDDSPTARLAVWPG